MFISNNSTTALNIGSSPRPKLLTATEQAAASAEFIRSDVGKNTNVSMVSVQFYTLVKMNKNSTGKLEKEKIEKGSVSAELMLF